MRRAIDLTPSWRACLVKEVRRKAIHITGLIVPFGIIAFGKGFTASMIALALVAALPLEKLRLSGRLRLPETREAEMGRIAGYVYYIAGSLITVAAFSPPIAITSMLLLSLGDATSGILGSVLAGCNIRDGYRRRRTKPLPILIGTFAACTLIGYVSSALLTGLPPLVYVTGAVAATLADGISVSVRGRYIDDNFAIPVFSGLVMTFAPIILAPIVLAPIAPVSLAPISIDLVSLDLAPIILASLA